MPVIRHRSCGFECNSDAKLKPYVVSKVFHITDDNVSFVCNVTEAVPFCQLLIHRNVTFLKNLQKFHSQHLVIGYLVRHSGKMNCMNYLTFCNLRL